MNEELLQPCTVLWAIFRLDSVISEHAEESLLHNKLNESHYNRLIRPAQELTSQVRIQFDLIISQLIGVVSWSVGL